ncbi:hypothetical protein N9427_10525 [Paracoccaceae bacterium]|nr:hypothetical protein [Paracoccaceae bacterium]
MAIAQAERARSYAAQVNAPLCTFVAKRQNPRSKRCGLVAGAPAKFFAASALSIPSFSTRAFSIWFSAISLHLSGWVAAHSKPLIVQMRVEAYGVPARLGRSPKRKG